MFASVQLLRLFICSAMRGTGCRESGHAALSTRAGRANSDLHYCHPGSERYSARGLSRLVIGGSKA